MLETKSSRRLYDIALILFFAAFGSLAGNYVREAGSRQLSSPQPVSFQTLTVDQTALGLSAATINPPDAKGVVQRCIGVVEGQPVRMRSTGTNPTATVGIPAAAGSGINLDGYAVIAGWRVIRDTTAQSTATINIECYREFR